MNRTSYLDKSMVALAVLLLCISGYLVMTIDDYLSRGTQKNLNDAIGSISHSSNDVRYRESSRIDWNRAQKKNAIFWNDSIFTGKKSKAKIDLKNGTKIKLKESSLVTFRKRKGINLMKLAGGQFEIDLKGDTEVEINGRVQKLSGNGSRLKISVDPKTGRSKFSVLSGKVKVTGRNGFEKTLKPKVVLKKKEDPPQVDKINDIVYFYKLYDLYEKKSENLVIKKNVKIQFSKTINISWRFIEGVSSYEVYLLKKNKNYQGRDHGKDHKYDELTKKIINQPRASMVVQSVGRYGVKARAINGSRIQLNGQWGPVQEFNVKEGYRLGGLFFVNSEKQVPLMNGRYDLKLKWQRAIVSTDLFTNYIVEASHSEEFPSLKTQVLVASKPELDIALRSEKDYFFRVRGVTQGQELSEWSQVYRVKAFLWKPLARPKIFNKDNLQLDLDWRRRELWSWSSIPSAKKYEFEVFSVAQNKTIFKTRTPKAQYLWKGGVPGEYKLRVRAQDQYGKFGAYSKLKSFSIKRPAPIVNKLAKKKRKKEKKRGEEEERKTASENTLRHKNKVKEKKNYNRHYSDSYFQTEGASLALLNSTAQDSESAFALAMAMTLRGVYWWQSSQGVEGSVKTKVLGYNDDGQKVSPTSLDARYHYRFRFGLPWASFIRQIQLSLFSGAEYYQNSSDASLNFIDSYTLLKLGTSLKFALWNKWETGGEFAYGSGMRGMAKMEMQGYVNYYLRSRWALGLGYRLHLFKVGDVNDSPDGRLPYGEAYAEGFGSLRYSF